MTNKRKTVYLNDNSVLEDFYRAIKENRLDTLHIPHSDVFFVRSALRERTGHTYPNGVFIYDHTNRKEILISDPSTDSKKLKSHVSRIHNKIKRDGDYKSPVGKVLIDTPHRVSVKEIKEGESKGSVRTHSDKKSSSSRSSSARGGGGGVGLSFKALTEGNLPGRRKMNKGGLISAGTYFKHKVNKDN